MRFCAFLCVAECGANISGKSNGMIHSPNYPEKYASSDMGGSMQCHWFINASPGHRILLFFETFEVEGKPIGKPKSSKILMSNEILIGSWQPLRRTWMPRRNFTSLAMEGT